MIRHLQSTPTSDSQIRSSPTTLSRTTASTTCCIACHWLAATEAASYASPAAGGIKRCCDLSVCLSVPWILLNNDAFYGCGIVFVYFDLLMFSDVYYLYVIFEVVKAASNSWNSSPGLPCITSYSNRIVGEIKMLDNAHRRFIMSCYDCCRPI